MSLFVLFSVPLSSLLSSLLSSHPLFPQPLTALEQQTPQPLPALALPPSSPSSSCSTSSPLSSKTKQQKQQQQQHDLIKEIVVMAVFLFTQPSFRLYLRIQEWQI